MHVIEIQNMNSLSTVIKLCRIITFLCVSLLNKILIIFYIRKGILKLKCALKEVLAFFCRTEKTEWQREELINQCLMDSRYRIRTLAFLSSFYCFWTIQKFKIEINMYKWIFQHFHSLKHIVITYHEQEPCQ